jgi:hypothetical protein
MKREPMETLAGMSVRAEIDLRLEHARAAAIEEVIVFLGGRGHIAAAEDLQLAAFGEQAEQADV